MNRIFRNCSVSGWLRALKRTGVRRVLDRHACEVLRSHSCNSYVVKGSRGEHWQLFAGAFNHGCVLTIVFDQKLDVRSSFHKVRDGPLQQERGVGPVSNDEGIRGERNWRRNRCTLYCWLSMLLFVLRTLFDSFNSLIKIREIKDITVKTVIKTVKPISHSNSLSKIKMCKKIIWSLILKQPIFSNHRSFFYRCFI